MDTPAKPIPREASVLPRFDRQRRLCLALAGLVLFFVFVFPLSSGLYQDLPAPSLHSGMTYDQVRHRLASEPRHGNVFWSDVQNGSVKSFVAPVIPGTPAPKPGLAIVHIRYWNYGKHTIVGYFDNQDRALQVMVHQSSFWVEMRQLRRRLFGY